MEALFLAENRPSTLLKRFATPEDMANISVYVASPQASATTRLDAALGRRHRLKHYLITGVL